MNTRWPVFAIDNYFDHADRIYSAEERWDILKRLGYNQGYVSVNPTVAENWHNFLAAHENARCTGLSLAGVYMVLDVKPAPPTGEASIPAVLSRLQPGETLELSISYGWQVDCSDSSHDDEVVTRLAPLLEMARERAVTISLYHHFGFWMERIEDCIRIAKRINDPALRVTFCGFHWYVIDRKDIAERLRLAAPWLHSVNISGSRPEAPSGSGLPASIEPVGGGDFPLLSTVAALREVGFQGSVGFQGYKIGGCPMETLGQSIDAFRRALALTER